MSAKIVLTLDDIDFVNRKLTQASSMASFASFSNDLEVDVSNVFWAIKDLISDAIGKLDMQKATVDEDTKKR